MAAIRQLASVSWRATEEGARESFPCLTFTVYQATDGAYLRYS